MIVGGPFELRKRYGENCWAGPAGMVSTLDLSPIAAQSEPADVVARGNALFLLDDAARVDLATYHLFSAGSAAADATMRPVDRSAFRRLFGVGISDSTATLKDAIGQALMELSDSSGSSGIGSLQPAKSKRGYKLRIQFAGSWFEKFDASHPHVRKWLQRQRADLQKIYDRDGEERAGKVLDFTAREIKRATGSEPDIGALIPEKLKGKVKRGNAQTIVTDDFSDMVTIDDNWTAVSGDAINFSSNGASLDCMYPASWTRQVIRRNEALSAADHYSQLGSMTLSGSLTQLGLVGRCSNSDYTCYGVHSVYGNTGNAEIAKRIAGVETLLTGNFAMGVGAGVAWKLDIAGSDLTVTKDESEKSSVTDSSITGNLYGGIHWLSNGGVSSADVDDFELSDGLGGGVDGRRLSRIAGTRSRLLVPMDLG